MKYTIELTEAEREVICNVIRTVRDNSLGEHRLFENTTIFKFDEESTDYSVAYLRGKEDGNKIADKDLKEIQDSTYDVAYNKGLADARQILLRLLAIPSGEYTKMFDNEDCYYIQAILSRHSIPEIEKEVKAYEEKEEIKVGDIVYYGEEMLKAVVLDIFTEQGITVAVMLNENGLNVNEELSGLKFIEHTNEVEQLLDKLRGE